MFTQNAIRNLSDELTQGLPDVATPQPDGSLHIDLLALAARVGAPITPDALRLLGRMAQTYARKQWPDVECHILKSQTPTT